MGGKIRIIYGNNNVKLRSDEDANQEKTYLNQLAKLYLQLVTADKDLRDSSRSGCNQRLRSSLINAWHTVRTRELLEAVL